MPEYISHYPSIHHWPDKANLFSASVEKKAQSIKANSTKKSPRKFESPGSNQNGAIGTSVKASRQLKLSSVLRIHFTAGERRELQGEGQNFICFPYNFGIHPWKTLIQEIVTYYKFTHGPLNYKDKGLR
jgi:hypothetical protein